LFQLFKGILASSSACDILYIYLFFSWYSGLEMLKN